MPKPSILRHTARSRARVDQPPATTSRGAATGTAEVRSAPRTTFTGIIGTLCMFPLRAIIGLCVALRVHPNTLTLIGVIINVGAAWALAYNRFILAGVIMIVANIFDFIDGKVAHQL